MALPKIFRFADPQRHEGGGDSMGRPSRTARDADRRGARFISSSDRTQIRGKGGR
uniref:hypothetical protein n=1 Tax=Streptomyces natalensis TaxID=68242 RepID=UPI00186850D8|nr:hypothetical protein [Streptomyces natalensis]